MSRPSSELINTVVTAGAGAGKTRGLVEKVVAAHREALTLGLPAPRLVLTTFTRKATQEIKERLLLRACADQDASLLQYVSDPRQLHISTIHGLLHMFLQQVGHLAGLDVGFQVVNEGEAAQMARMALREIVVHHPEAAQWLENYGFDRLLLMCRRYDQERRQRHELEPATHDDLVAARTEARNHWQAQFAPVLQLIDQTTSLPAWVSYRESWLAFLASDTWGSAALEQIPTKPRRNAKQPELEPLHAAVENLVDKLKSELRRPGWDETLWSAMVSSWVQIQPLFQQFAQNLNASKEAQGRFEIADLELKSLALLQSHPFLATIFNEDWDFWMIDEFQDTSPVQVRILEALMGDSPRYLVGDPQQSIYLFRGAEVAVFHSSRTQLLAQGGRGIELTRNYRSKPELLVWINEFMRGYGTQFTPMEPRERSEAQSEPCVTLIPCVNRDAENDHLVAQVNRLLANGARLEQICVLGRTHRNLMMASRQLRAFGFPTHVHAARGFQGRREVLDAMAVWKFLLNPHDGLNLLVLLRSPWFHVPDWQLAEWQATSPASLWRHLQPQVESHEPLLRLRQLLQRSERDGVAQAFEQGLVESGMLDLALLSDPAGRKESNLWKLVLRAHELVRSGGSLFALAQMESDNALEDNEGDATSAQEPGCINLMTIHGAKGLEFDHVLIAGMGEAPNTSNVTPFQVEGRSYHFPVWDSASHSFVPSPLDVRVIRRQRQRELAEFDRWLYVAVTRAKQSLTLLWSNPEVDSWAARNDWFKLAPGPYPPAEVVTEWPAPQPHIAPTEDFKTVPAQWGLSSLTLLSPQRTSVTDWVTAASVEAASGEQALKNWRSRAAGVEVHRWLEALKYGHAPDLSEDPAMVKAMTFVQDLQNPPIAEIFATGQSEWGFQIQTPSGLLEGQVDLWGVVGEILHIIDYKSGSPQFSDQAFAQLELYAWALRRFGVNESVQLSVVYPLRGEVKTRSLSAESLRTWENKLGFT